jgi:hypothetical protein
MCDIPGDLRAELENRVREQIASEVRGDVLALYEFTLPSIRAQRIMERDDEPELSLSSIREFVRLIDTADVLSIGVEQFQPLRRAPRPPVRSPTLQTTVRVGQRSSDRKGRSGSRSETGSG